MIPNGRLTLAHALAEVGGVDQNSADQGIDFSAMQATERVRIDDSELQRRVIEEVRGRSIFWILGTSLIFEFMILSLAAWIFCRRDF